MYNLLRSYFDIFYNNEIERLKKENNVLKYKLQGTITAKNDIYKKYQNLIINIHSNTSS